MQHQITLKLLPSEAANPQLLTAAIAAAIAKPATSISGYSVLKKSLDARGMQAWVNLTLSVFADEPFIDTSYTTIVHKDVRNAAHSIIIVGAGPAGLFAALRLLQAGIKPIILERGKEVRARRRDLAQLNKAGVVNPDSNYCFGEGGAGTYSDGKLYTRSKKRGDINRILQLFVQFGAEHKILYEAHPHIGTNKLPQIITAIRQAIIECGGQMLFEQKVTGLLITSNSVYGVQTANGDTLKADAVILATGHSARDIFLMLHDQNILIEAKPFALGVRIEHPQTIIDSIQYHNSTVIAGEQARGEFLPPAAYSLVEQVQGKGVFSFCMCPGGIIAPAATNPGELVVNGWSPSKRNNPFANSGMVVSVETKDLAVHKPFITWLRSMDLALVSPLALMYFQQKVEQDAFAAGGGNFVAPATRLVDFCNGNPSANLPTCSYLPGLASADLNTCLPPFIMHRLQAGFKAFGNRMRGFYTNEAVVIATESRTSSPVRIPRDNETLEHPQIKNLYPCGEGAGYAGGIVSAAIDGERVAAKFTEKLSRSVDL